MRCCHRNTSKKSDELICTGKIEVIRKLAEFDEKGHRTDYAVIRITGANLTTTEVNVPKEYVSNHKFIQEIFEKNEGIVHAPGKLSSVLDLSSLDVTDIKPILDLILEELFAHKKSIQANGVVTCTLILDEVQNFNLDGLSSLAHQILRQRRKFGISTVMAMQYLSSDDAKNIGKLLKQCESFCSFKTANALDTMKIMSREKNEAAQYCLNNLETGQVIVSGAFSTDRCSIRYPVKVFVENDE